MAQVIDHAVVSPTGERRTVERRYGFLFLRKKQVTQEAVIVQPWDTNTGRDVGPEIIKWRDIRGV